MASQYAGQPIRSERIRRGVPQSWETRRLKSCVSDVVNLTDRQSSEDIYIALENVEGWTGKISEPVAEVKFESQAKRFEAGDVLFGKLRPYLAKVARPRRSGVCVGEFLVLRAHDGAMEPRYLELLMRSKHVIDEVNASTFGAKMPRADWRFIGNMSHAIPPLDEQAAIVRYLDHADELINRYISAKERLIALLEEQRQAVIHQLVAGGFDPSVQMMPPRMDPPSEVAKHWRKHRLKEVASIQQGITIGPHRNEPGFIQRPYLRVANVQAGYLDLAQITTTGVSPAEISRSTLQVGDVLMTEGGDIDKLGRGCIWQGEIADCMHQNHIFAVRPDHSMLNPAFLVALMGSSRGRNYFYVTAKQTTNLAATNRNTLGNFPIHLPTVAEQQTIVNEVDQRSAATEAVITKTRRQIDNINEYRTRLIADVVTGQLDVRHATIRIPD